jgi:tripartite-type tricarboxylate transporter receptor subunit TctC
MSRTSKFASLVAAGVLVTFGPAPSSAQDYPSKPIRLVVPYPPGSGTDIIGRRLGESLGQQVFVDNVLSVRGFLESGQLRTVAIGTAERSPAMPEVPTVAESTQPSFRAGVWFGLLAPAETPRAIIDRLNAETVRVLQTPDFKAKLIEQGAESVPSSAEQFSALIQAEITKWADVIRSSGVRME